jgi:Mg-chelatase subunit ChlD
MTKKERTTLTLVVDRSGSMYTIQKAMNEAIQQLLTEQRKIDGKLRVNVVAFDDTVEFRYTDAKAKDIEQYLIEARGNTALNDAVAAGIVVTAADPNGPSDHYILAIITDGMENASKDFPGVEGREKIKAMLDEKRAAGWEILFIGAESMGDVMAAAGGYGVGRGQTISFVNTAAGADSVVASASAYMGATRKGKKDVSFTEDDRTKAAQK